jgi:hypothetical protein
MNHARCVDRDVDLNPSVALGVGRATWDFAGKGEEPASGFEPETPSLQVKCSAS